MGISCGLSYLEDKLPDVEIFEVDKMHYSGVKAWEILSVFTNAWVPNSVPLMEGEVEDEYACTLYFTLEQIFKLRGNKILDCVINWQDLERFVKASPARNKRFMVWFGH